MSHIVVIYGWLYMCVCECLYMQVNTGNRCVCMYIRATFDPSVGRHGDTGEGTFKHTQGQYIYQSAIHNFRLRLATVLLDCCSCVRWNNRFNFSQQPSPRADRLSYTTLPACPFPIAPRVGVNYITGVLGSSPDDLMACFIQLVHIYKTVKEGKKGRTKGSMHYTR